MDISTPYSRALNHQVSRMLELAQAKHPDYLEDCLIDPWRITGKWKGDLSISRVDSIVTSELAEQGDTVVDDQHDLLGLFHPAIGDEKINRIEVQHNRGDYTPRRNFTLLHEIGHYLQQTSDELVDNLIGISSLNVDKRFEEEACNRFASVSLLPRKYVESVLHGGVVDAGVASRMYEQGRRKRGRNIRVSRPAIARRLVDFLSFDGSVTLTSGEELTLRAHRDGRIDYDEALTPMELDMIRLMRSNSPMPPQLSRIVTLENGTSAFASISCSPSGAMPRYFIVTQIVD